LFLWDSPNNNGNRSIDRLMFRSWNRAQYQWNPLVKIGGGGDFTTDSRQITSLAYGSSTNTFAAASEASDPQGGTDIQVYVSTGGGARPFPATPSARPNRATSSSSSATRSPVRLRA
jgi:hypothetical protein